MPEIFPFASNNLTCHSVTDAAERYKPWTWNEGKGVAHQMAVLSVSIFRGSLGMSSQADAEWPEWHRQMGHCKRGTLDWLLQPAPSPLLASGENYLSGSSESFLTLSILHFSNSLTSIEHPSIKLNSGIMRSQHTSTGWKIQLTLQYQDSLQSQHFWPIMPSLSQIVCSRSHFIHYDGFITEAMVPFIVKDAVLKFPMGNSEYAKPETWVSWQSSHRFWHQFQMPPITLFRGFMDGSLCWVDWWNHWPLVFKKF